MDFRVRLAGDTGQADLITFGGYSTLNSHDKEVTKLTFHTRDYNDFVRLYQDRLWAQEC